MENTMMTIEEKIARMEALKDEYYDIEGDKDKEKDIYEQVQALELDKIGFLQDEDNVRGQFYVCPDLEWEFPDVFEIAKKYMSAATNIIADAYLEYYKNNDFYDDVAIDCDVLIAVRLQNAKIPIIRHAGVSDVELLNVRWLNRNR